MHRGSRQCFGFDCSLYFQLAPVGRPYLGSEMTLESFRWDQRLFTCVINLTPPIILPNGGQPIEPLCASTGGRSYISFSFFFISCSSAPRLTYVSHFPISPDCMNRLPVCTMSFSFLLMSSPLNITLDELHQLPIAQMGNYEEYIKGLAAVGRGPLRPVEPTPVRTHAFGNPFKTDKKSLAIDELSSSTSVKVGEGPVGANAAVPTTKESRRERVKGDGIGRPPKRKPGPVAPNCLQQWRFAPLQYFTFLLSIFEYVTFMNWFRLTVYHIRERRQTLSERSSVVSDLSYTSDLDLEIPSTSSDALDDMEVNEVTNGIDSTTLVRFSKTGVETLGFCEQPRSIAVCLIPDRASGTGTRSREWRRGRRRGTGCVSTQAAKNRAIIGGANV
ncbi:unnamed protein product [Haemonchus placei]|uniref:Uncharacterized protein n=1 Tax=Haemonchus placei TaxID=6290 RepID=A0A0N4WB29_HAEPC|nr:unnamed protein product [Haemonchus placei]